MGRRTPQESIKEMTQYLFMPSADDPDLVLKSKRQAASSGPSSE